MSVHVNERRYAISRIPQTNYLTPTTPSASGSKSHRKVIATDKNFADYIPDTGTDKGQAHGHDWATEQYILSHDASAPKNIEVSSEEIGRWLLLAFGLIATSQPDATNAPNTYKHVFSPQDANTSRQLPATSYVEQIGSAFDVLYPSCCVEKLGFKCEGKGRITADAILKASGKRTSTSGVSFSGGTVHVSVPSGLHFFYNSQSALIADDGSSPINYQCDYEKFMFSVENQFLADDAYRPGCPQYQTANTPSSGMTRAELLFGDRNYPSSFVVRLASGGAEHAALKAQTSIAVTHTLTGDLIEDVYSHQLIFKLFISKYKTVKLGEQNGIVTLEVTPELLYDTANSRIVQVELFNTIASYTT